MILDAGFLNVAHTADININLRRLWNFFSKPSKHFPLKILKDMWKEKKQLKKQINVF